MISLKKMLPEIVDYDFKLFFSRLRLSCANCLNSKGELCKGESSNKRTLFVYGLLGSSGVAVGRK